MILDATSSVKRRWPEKADVRADIDPATRPDVVADATNLPFRNGAFDEVYCDPPHFISFGGTGRWKRQFAEDMGRARATYARFKTWATPGDFSQFLDASLPEFVRCLKAGGKLHYKVPDGSRSHGRVIDYRQVIVSGKHAGLRLNWVEVRISEGLLSRGNVRQGKAPTLVLELEFIKPLETTTPIGS